MQWKWGFPCSERDRFDVESLKSFVIVSLLQTGCIMLSHIFNDSVKYVFQYSVTMLRHSLLLPTVHSSATSNETLFSHTSTQALIQKDSTYIHRTSVQILQPRNFLFPSKDELFILERRALKLKMMTRISELT